MPAAAQTLRKLERRDQERLAPAFADLATNPRPPGATKLHRQPNIYRIRVGDFRIIYSPDDARRRVTITRIGHRRDVYR
jgi:mRNA interferase RelE/StbE